MDPTPTSTAPGGGGSTPIDLLTEKDRGLVREASKRWPKRWRGLTDELKDHFVSSLKEADRLARAASNEDPIKAAATLASIVRTAAVMEGQQQADDHANDKNARIDAGLNTEKTIVEVVHIERTPPTAG